MLAQLRLPAAGAVPFLGAEAIVAAAAVAVPVKVPILGDEDATGAAAADAVADAASGEAADAVSAFAIA